MFNFQADKKVTLKGLKQEFDKKKSIFQQKRVSGGLSESLGQELDEMALHAVVDDQLRNIGFNDIVTVSYKDESEGGEAVSLEKLKKIIEKSGRTFHQRKEP